MLLINLHFFFCLSFEAVSFKSAVYFELYLLKMLFLLFPYCLGFGVISTSNLVTAFRVKILACYDQLDQNLLHVLEI